MKFLTSKEEYNVAIQDASIVIFATNSELEAITQSDYLTNLESAIPDKHKLFFDFYIANIENLMDVAMDLEIIGTPAIAFFTMGELITCHICGNYEDFDGYNEDDLFDLSLLPDVLSEFLEDLD